MNKYINYTTASGQGKSFLMAQSLRDLMGIRLLPYTFGGKVINNVPHMEIRGLGYKVDKRFYNQLFSQVVYMNQKNIKVADFRL